MFVLVIILSFNPRSVEEKAKGKKKEKRNEKWRDEKWVTIKKQMITAGLNINTTELKWERMCT